jgi:uncharacterized membrane protein
MTTTATALRRKTTMDEIVITAARTTNGLLAGIYFAFAVAIMPALHRLPDDVYVRVFNQINEVIVNPFFMIAFLGAPLTALLVLRWDHGPLAIAAAGTAVLALVITVLANIPLNNALAEGGTRAAFETPWLIWHAVRTAAALAAVVLLSMSAVGPLSSAG